ncbi:hypothetical protein ACE1ET_20250 [Saccharicrinis sp. FJH62]|uniref:hypothetical protein n=1 Tax=Saccharicrinis sp. FJH62 TaxID=3344657 RepID=UPI0035D440D7
MKYKLEREIHWSSYRIGLIIVLVLLIFFVVVINLIPNLNLNTRLSISALVIIFHLLMTYLIYVANRRFLRSIIFDFDKETIEYFSIIKSISKRIQFTEIEVLKTIKSQGFRNFTNGFRNHNLVLRIKNNSQPQIFEIRNSSDFEKSNLIIEKINTTHNTRS